MTPESPLITAEQFYRQQVPHKRTELVRGRMLVHEPAAWRHGEVAARLLLAIGTHVTREGCGHVLAAETGFTLERDPDTVRAPDVAYIRNERWPPPDQSAFAEMAPDLAVEVLSPSDRRSALLAKIADWLEAGTSLVWVVDPDRRFARVYRADGTETTLSPDEDLDGEDLLPGLRIRVSEMIE